MLHFKRFLLSLTFIIFIFANFDGIAVAKNGLSLGIGWAQEHNPSGDLNKTYTMDYSDTSSKVILPRLRSESKNPWILQFLYDPYDSGTNDTVSMNIGYGLNDYFAFEVFVVRSDFKTSHESLGNPYQDEKITADMYNGLEGIKIGIPFGNHEIYIRYGYASSLVSYDNNVYARGSTEAGGGTELSGDGFGYGIGWDYFLFKYFSFSMSYTVFNIKYKKLKIYHSNPDLDETDSLDHKLVAINKTITLSFNIVIPGI